MQVTSSTATVAKIKPVMSILALVGVILGLSLTSLGCVSSRERISVEFTDAGEEPGVCAVTLYDSLVVRVVDITTGFIGEGRVKRGEFWDVVAQFKSINWQGETVNPYELSDPSAVLWFRSIRGVEFTRTKLSLEALEAFCRLDGLARKTVEGYQGQAECIGIGPTTP